MLQSSLNIKLTEIEDLNSKISNLEADLEKSEFKRENEKHTCKQTITSLTESLNDVTRKLQERIDKCTEESQKRENLLKRFYTSLLQQKEDEYKKSILAVEDRLQKEICMMNISSSINRRCKSGQKLAPLSRIIKSESTRFKIQHKKSAKVKHKNKPSQRTTNRMQIITDENVSLRNRIIKLESQYTSEQCFLQTEIETLRNSNNDVIKEIDNLKTQRGNLEKDLDRIKYENGVLTTESRLNAEKVHNLLKQNKDIVLENATLKQQYQDMSKLYKGLLVSNEQLAHQNHILEVERNELNTAFKEHKDTITNKASLNKYDQILKQNTVLKDLVKQMKIDKKQIESNHVSEERIKKLEDLVEVLKKRAYGDS